MGHDALPILCPIHSGSMDGTLFRSCVPSIAFMPGRQEAYFYQGRGDAIKARGGGGVYGPGYVKERVSADGIHD